MKESHSYSSVSAKPAVDLRSINIARNTVINIIGIGVPYIVGFFCIPYIIRGLGVDRFGVLTLVWAIVGYFSFVDLGLAKASTKFVAESLGKGELSNIPKYVWTTIFMQCVLGLIGFLIILLTAPLLVDKILNIPPEFTAEVLRTVVIIGFSLPIILVSSSLRGILEASQRFDLINLIKIPISISFYLVPLIGLAFHWQLPGIVTLMVVIRLLSLVAWLIICLRVHPVLLESISFHGPLIKVLLRFGGWVSLSSILFYVTISIDRFIIGSLLSLKDVSYYSAPLEVVMRIGIIPGSFTMILFTAFSSLEGGNQEERSKMLFVRSIKYILMSIGPVVLILVFYAKPFLRIWLGSEFAHRSTLVIQILAIGFLVSSLSGVPFNLLFGKGRADLAAKLQIVELCLYIPLAFLLIKFWGINGAALAMAVKSVLITVLYFKVSMKIKPIKLQHLLEINLMKSIISIFVLAAIFILITYLRLKLYGFILAIIISAIITFFYVLTRKEKQFISRHIFSLFLKTH